MDKKTPKIKKCVNCGKQDETVKRRKCGYVLEIMGQTKWETICDACEHEHLMDI